MSRGVVLCHFISIFALLLQYAAVGDAQAPCPSSRIGGADEEDCGILSATFSISVVGGSNARREDMPWQAGVYSKLTEPPLQICGGSLVSRTVIISAAHCFWSDVEKQLPASNYAVAVGKLYRPWNDKMDDEAQRSDIREIHIPPRFHGPTTNFQDDLALLVVATPFTYEGNIQPVCLDFNYDLDRRQLSHGNLGKVAGWGRTDENGKASPTLQIADLPAVDVQQCFATIEPVFQPAITSDKICAGFATKGTAVCMGDSGGGLSFPDKNVEGFVQYFLRGVVSTAPRAANDNLCNIYTYATFTHLLKHEHFIREVMSNATNKSSSPEMVQTPSPATPTIAEPLELTPDLANPLFDRIIKAGGTPLPLPVDPQIQSDRGNRPADPTSTQGTLKTGGRIEEPNIADPEIKILEIHPGWNSNSSLEQLPTVDRGNRPLDPESTQGTINTGGTSSPSPGEITLPLSSTANKQNQPPSKVQSGTNPFLSGQPSTGNKPIPFVLKNQPSSTQHLPDKSIEVTRPQHHWSEATASSTDQATPSRLYLPSDVNDPTKPTHSMHTNIPSTFTQSVPATITTQTNPDFTFVNHKWHSDYQHHYHPHHYHHSPHYHQYWYDTSYHKW